jgi:hypothetical protein
MGQGHFNPKDFMAVEEHVHDRSIETMPVDELTKLKVSLVKNAPTAEINPIFQHRWDRAYTEISSLIDSKVAKRRFRIAICISIVILIVGLVNLVRGFIQ